MKNNEALEIWKIKANIILRNAIFLLPEHLKKKLRI
jgi:hypothetical protein